MTRFSDDPRRSADEYYVGRDPMRDVSGSILEFVRTRAGRRVIDLGCGTGGLAAHLQRLGFDVAGADRNRAHLQIAAGLGVPTAHVNGALPFRHKSVDTIVMIEVLEHVPDDAIAALMEEVRLVARRNVLMTVPDCQDVDALAPAGVTCEHFLAADHVQFFTRDRLHALLAGFFPRVEIVRGDPVVPHLLLPTVVRRPLSGLWRAGLLQPRFYTRLFVEAFVDG
jgi:SAM-dependent methyltransferase